MFIGEWTNLGGEELSATKLCNSLAYQEEIEGEGGNEESV